MQILIQFNKSKLRSAVAELNYVKIILSEWNKGKMAFNTEFNNQLGKGSKKKTIESVIMIIPDRGGAAGGDHTLLGFFLQCSKPIWLSLVSPKTNFVLI